MFVTQESNRVTPRAQEDDALFFSHHGPTSRLLLCQGIVSLPQVCSQAQGALELPNLNSVPFFSFKLPEQQLHHRSLISLTHFRKSVKSGYFRAILRVQAQFWEVFVRLSNSVRSADSAGRGGGIR